MSRANVVTLATVLRAADGTTRPIVITRNEGECSWGMVPDGYTGRRCERCDMPHWSWGLCKRHAMQTYRAARKMRQQTIGDSNV